VFSLERHSICRNFDKLSDANTIGDHGIIPLLPVLFGILNFFECGVSVRLHVSAVFTYISHVTDTNPIYH
jgi:hypothetical protein